MASHPVVSREKWLAARLELLEREKSFSRARDELSQARRALPWVRVSKAYVFDTPDGRRSLADLFGSNSQLIVYHFMFGPDAKAGCKMCSFWLDNLDRVVPHLAARDVAVAVVSRAPLDKLAAFKARLGWSAPWVSSGASSFNRDFGVAFTDDEIEAKSARYNYGSQSWLGPDMPGISVFVRDGKGQVFHTYSTYARGLEDLNVAYRYLDIVPKGRDEAETRGMVGWVKFRDQY